MSGSLSRSYQSGFVSKLENYSALLRQISGKHIVIFRTLLLLALSIVQPTFSSLSGFHNNTISLAAS